MSHPATATAADLAPLAAWLAGRLPGASRITLDAPRRPSGSGFSADTTFVTARWSGPDGPVARELVLRRETADDPMYPHQGPGAGPDVEIALQYAVMSALAGAPGVPLAPLIGYEADPAVLGTPFYVMDFVAGQVPVENPPYTVSGFFADATAGQRAAMLDDGMRVLAAVHRVDPYAAGLAPLLGGAPGTDPALRQLALWEEYARTELRGREHPVLERGLTWLREHLPGAAAAAGPVTLSWGDARPGNMIWRDFRCVCVTDFEAAALGPAELDLGWWLMFDRASHDAIGVPRLPGEPTREEQRAAYEAHAGRTVGDTRPWEVLAAFRYTAIVVRAMNRAEDRGLMPAGRTVWRDNPASAALAQLLDELDELDEEV